MKKFLTVTLAFMLLVTIVPLEMAEASAAETMETLSKEFKESMDAIAENNEILGLIERYETLSREIESEKSIPTLSKIDYSQLPIEELLTIRNEIERTLLNHGAKTSFAVPSGIYEVGLDFPEGTYTVTLEAGYLSTLIVGLSEKALESYDVISMYMVAEENIIGKIKLEKGRFISINGSPIVFTVYTGIKLD